MKTINKFSVIKDVDKNFVDSIKKDKGKYAIYKSMVKLEKMGIYVTDYDCFSLCSFYTGKNKDNHHKIA